MSSGDSGFVGATGAALKALLGPQSSGSVILSLREYCGSWSTLSSCGSFMQEEKCRGKRGRRPSPKLRALELAFASSAPPCLAGQRDGKFSSEQDSSHDSNLILLG